MRNQGNPGRAASLLGTLLLCFVAFGLLASAAQKKPVAGSVFVPEKGKFNILLDGKSVGREEYEIFGSGGAWTAHGSTSLKPPEAVASTVTGTLTLQPDGVPISYEWTSQAEKSNAAHVMFANGVAKMTLQLQGARPFEQDLSFSSPRIVVLDNNLYHQYGVLARVYDWSKRDTQTFPVLIPQELTPGTITVDWVGAVSADGKSYEGLKVITNDLEILLYLDGSHRLVRLEVPAAKVAIVRE
jgi:hypothetical protein